ncbi:hypothetical protein KRR38_01340 [Novosphingobium sp. G106]|uniref:hypothetical protein n=1 Tax=Novosphingobium sp. G106 TaxID=2849500 RepID=UPI001C2CF195|nr:hypothetical protein [Novosphingobium sp. G106]MBV1686348.1 hypothetical protein [Novosphingobium sp. G106]
MRLVFVHGINQQTKSSASIQQAWLDVLRPTGSPGDWPGDAVSGVATPFYGDQLFALSEAGRRAAAIAQGAGEIPDEFAEFAGPALAEMAFRAGADESAMAAEADKIAIAQGAGPHKTWLKAAARAIEAISPLKGEIALRLLGQAHAYLKRPHIMAEIDDVVRPALEGDEPMIIVAHSLGTIVTYKLLREFSAAGKPRQCPLYVTLGSPLGIDVVRKSFALPRGRPADVARWVNGADPEDFVALRSVLDATTFGSGIENISNIENGYDDPHAITRYLANADIASLIRTAIG